MYSEDSIRNEAKLISEGSKALTIIGQCQTKPEMLSATGCRIAALAPDGVLPFIVGRADGLADYGYAAAWVVALYHWTKGEEVPPEHSKRIVALLLGSGVSDID